MNRYEYNKVTKMLDELQKNLDTIRAIIDGYDNLDDAYSEKKGKEAAVEFLKKILSDGELQLPEEYTYSCLPLCLMDAIYSIGVRYTSTKKVVERYYSRYEVEPFGDRDDTYKFDEKHKLSNLIENIEAYKKDETGFVRFAEKVLKNKQRTSSRNGVLKIEAVYECAKILRDAGVETLCDFNEKMNDEKVADEIKQKYCQVKGQSSGISLDYLKMLCGRTDVIKPDRHIIRFLNRFSEDEINVQKAPDMMKEILQLLKEDYPNLDLRTLDYIIWEYMKDSALDFDA